MFYFEIITDSYAIERNNTGVPATLAYLSKYIVKSMSK